MPNPILFEEALSATEGVNRSLLVGNGFSYKYFSYTNLLDNAGLETNEPLRSLFDTFDTVDFEAIIKTLEDAALVEGKYNKPSRVLKLGKEAGKLRRALVHAVRAVHPDFHFEIEGLNLALQFISNFSSLFTLNYDFLLHWVRLQDPERFWDGFGLGGNNGGFRGPFTPEAWCNVYNVHGGLHLFAEADGSVRKRIGEPAIIEAIGKTISEDGRLPLYVAEGSSSQKLSRIFGSPYLRHCFDKIKKCDGAFFVFGHSANRSDEHVYDQIFKSAADHLYFFVHEPTQAKVALLNAELERYKVIAESEIEFTFVDSGSANVWG
ncbi:DUF4917 family protein [Bradyrhizobium betae]|uniref:DUF4917 family protein n=1 Tax=Bradyrhizobium betae TaxID=244734 RepID=A0A4V1P6U8_9BRAD|nr:DUF4917 family protein [Bradyrhizobium betae]RXT48859.1 hypothetical protein B5V03_13275 [Bradyrhizobium betae]